MNNTFRNAVFKRSVVVAFKKKKKITKIYWP